MKTIFNKILGGLILAVSIQLTHNSISIDSSTTEYYNKFITIADKCEKVVNKDELRVEVRYDENSEPYYAVTYTELNLIVINYTKFIKLRKIEQEQTVVHELGHALLKLDHSDRYLNLMNARGFITELDYIVNYDYYIRKLFKGCKYKGKFIYE